MGDCAEDFKALKAYHKDKKAARQAENLKALQCSGLSYSTDSSGSIHVQTDKGKVIFYPTTNKYQHRDKVFYGDALAFIKYVYRLFT